MPPRAFPASAPGTPVRSRRRALALLAAAAAGWALGMSAPVAADVIPVKSAELRVEDGEVLLNAEFDVSINPTLEEALKNGVPLYFVLEVEIARPRWYWLDEKVATFSTTWRVAYAPLTQHYRVSAGLIAQIVESLPEVERLIGRVTSRPIARATDFAAGSRYEASVRLRLDVNQLPKPFQVNALTSREWQLASDWRRFTFTP